MEMILRIVYANKIEDFDLSRQRQRITVGAFRASPSGGWNYRCGEDSGMLRPGDVILIDEDKSIAALVLEKHQGRAAWLDWRDGLTIGRKIGNQIALKDGLVSSRHCQIVRRKGSWYVEDLNSTNGTFLNDKRVTRAPFRPGDVLKLGRYRLRAGEKRLCLENLDGGCDPRCSGSPAGSGGCIREEGLSLVLPGTPDSDASGGSAYHHRVRSQHR